MNGDGLNLEMVSLSRQVYSGTVDHVTAPSYQGDMEIYRGHCAIMALLKPGQIKVNTSQQEIIYYYVSGGVLEVYNNTVSILADTIIRAEDIDEAATVMDQQQLEQLLSNRQAGRNYGKMLTKMTQARAKLRTVRNYSRNIKNTS